MIPTLTTERLVLRGPTLDDLADATAMWSDPEITRFIGGVPFSEEDVWGRILRYVGHWQLFDYGTWFARDHAGRFVGEVGLFDLHRQITPPLELPEAGWVLSRSVHGQGYATEAMTAVLAWGEQRFGHAHASCIIDPGNTPSLRVADKLGFRQRMRTTYRGSPSVLLAR